MWVTLSSNIIISDVVRAQKNITAELLKVIQWYLSVFMEPVWLNVNRWWECWRGHSVSEHRRETGKHIWIFSSVMQLEETETVMATNQHHFKRRRSLKAKWQRERERESADKKMEKYYELIFQQVTDLSRVFVVWKMENKTEMVPRRRERQWSLASLWPLKPGLFSALILGKRI